jgi:elongation factor Ts
MDTIKQLREETGLSFAQIKKALDEAAGDADRAREILRSYSATQAEKKADREIAAGVVASYVHGTATMGAIIVLGCETDFVANNPEFRAMANDIAMHVCAMAPSDEAELMAQPFIKNGELTVEGYIQSGVQKFGENVKLKSFSRYTV